MSGLASDASPSGAHNPFEKLLKFRYEKKSILSDKCLPNGKEKSPLKQENGIDSNSVHSPSKESPSINNKIKELSSSISIALKTEFPLNTPSSSLENGGNDNESPLESPIKPGKRKAKVLSSDTEDDSPKPNGVRSSKKSKPLDIDEEGRTSLENALKDLHDAFPGKDILILQDALFKAECCVSKAKTILSESFSNTSTSDGTIKKKLNGVGKIGKKKKKEMDSCEEDNESDEDDDGRGYKKRKVYDSDADSDEEVSDDLSGDKKKVFMFLCQSDLGELQKMQCSKKKAELIIESRPFDGWKHLVEKLQKKGGAGCEVLNAAQELLQTREVAAELIKKCGKLASKMETAVAAGLSDVQSQPSIMSENLKLSDYQLVGLNWLLVLNTHQVNGILADEMGLGKTVQIIAFLSYLKEKKLAKPGKPHLIVVPASTLENWQNEFTRWSPSVNVSVYYGSQEDRKYQRIEWSKNGFGDTEVVLTTYGMITSCPEERKMFRIIPLHYAIFDEAHMLKNMYTQRYEQLIKINAPNRVLVTGTPLQNNLLELMSLLVFVMPKLFRGKQETLKALFTKGSKQQNNKSDSESSLPEFERTQIFQAKHIMKPFVLRRLKCDVLKDLPQKTDELMQCPMTEDQEQKYNELIAMFSRQAAKELNGDDPSEPSESGMAMYMKLRRLANHPLLLRYHFKDETLKEMAKRLQKDIIYKDTVFQYILDDLNIMSDFELHNMCLDYKTCYNLRLPPSVMGESGKLKEIEKLLPKLKEEGHRVLIFSQFVIVLDVLEEFFEHKGYKFLRLDGSTPVPQRQDLIDEYNRDTTILIFMLSTRAGGLGINLTSADTVIIHDVDPNPHNDKQAEDRCHRIGQTKPVKVIRLISKGTIEENIMNLAQEKLLLEKEVSTNEENDQSEKKSVAKLLKQALGMDKRNSGNSKSPIKSSAL